MKHQAKVYLIPNTLGSEADTTQSFPPQNRNIIESLNHFAVENIKETRRFLVRLGLKHKIDESEFHTLDKRSNSMSIQPILSALKSGESVGIISDAGCPGIADPGSILVREAHKSNIQVVPLVGPSSILLALIGSGFNGQSFTFHGYLSREKEKRIKKLKEIESSSKSQKQTQIFMETPYRNEALWEDILQALKPSTSVCVAANLTLESEFLRTKSILDWKKGPKPNLHRVPTIFCLFA